MGPLNAPQVELPKMYVAHIWRSWQTHLQAGARGIVMGQRSVTKGSARWSPADGVMVSLLAQACNPDIVFDDSVCLAPHTPAVS